MKKNIAEKKEKNRLLQVTDFTIPYIKELKQLSFVKSTNACILMQQLEYWFVKYPHGFYKFLAPPDSIQFAYKEGDSWKEELAISEDEYRTAFDQIGTRYASKKEYDQSKSSGDVFRGKYYCSYFNKVSRLTHYFRNNEKVEAAIDFVERLPKSSSRDGESNLTESIMPIPRDKEYQSIENEFVYPESTETTTNTNSDSYSERELPNGNENSHSNKLTNGSEEKTNNHSANVMEAGQSTFHSGTSFNDNSADASPDERILIPLDFEPTWDAKFRAIRKYPRKSPAEVTKSLIAKKRESGTKMPIQQWHQTWDEWMSRQWETQGNEDLENEHSDILYKVKNDVFCASYKCDQLLFSFDEIEIYLKEDYSADTITDAIERLFESDNFGRVGNYYFNWANIKDSREQKIELQKQIAGLNLADERIEVYSKLANAKSLNEIRASRKKA